jgi:phosphatidylinositol glycan class V
LQSEKLSYRAAVLYCLTPAPATLSLPYNEPFFALLAFSGMLAIQQRRYLLAAMFFAGSTAFRANGVLFAGFFVWHLLIKTWPVRSAAACEAD